ncbi:uncharacterized protein N7500_001606 [Penicillium coprophilum]|uniref:uncharacterized protein n=1 Tax=Penicillium coprophilum TaxID=36646 RepID=UPI002396FC45|nr:uncharacterized protein N7500_001606 [Penicillium coprophilum]KAJ5173675.1 hypothetical protein N7500_001606 [Penicillium coprophilum]
MPYAAALTDSHILGDIINAHESAEEKNYDQNREVTPALSRETAKHIRPLLGYFKNCKQHVDATMMTDDFPQPTIDYIKTCEGNATRVNEIFSGVVGSSNAMEQYRRVARGYLLEDLMKKMLENVIAMSNATQLAVLSGAELQELNESLGQLQAMPASLPESKSQYSFSNHGSGNQNINTSTGHQYNNTGSGNVFTGTIHGFSMTR